MPVNDDIRVLVLGTGEMGAGIARLVVERPGVTLVGAYARRPERAELDVGEVIGLDRQLGIPVRNDLDGLIRDSQPDVAIQATWSRIADARAELDTLVAHGVNVISIAEEMAHPATAAPDYCEQLHWQAVGKGVAVLGTGVNPGFVLDLLIITLTAACAEVNAIRATRSNDLSPYGPSVLSTQGVGLSPEAFAAGVEKGTVVGHIGFAESIDMIATAIGWEIERIEEHRRPIISRVRRETPHVTVEPGQVAGCLHTAIAYRDGEPAISLTHPQQVRPEREGEETLDQIEILGRPHIHLTGSPEIPGGEATIALAVNMIPRLLNAAPGVHTMADLPVPHAMLGDMRRFLHRDFA